MAIHEPMTAAPEASETTSLAEYVTSKAGLTEIAEAIERQVTVPYMVSVIDLMRNLNLPDNLALIRSFTELPVYGEMARSPRYMQQIAFARAQVGRFHGAYVEGRHSTNPYSMLMNAAISIQTETTHPVSDMEIAFARLVNIARYAVLREFHWTREKEALDALLKARGMTRADGLPARAEDIYALFDTMAKERGYTAQIMLDRAVFASEKTNHPTSPVALLAREKLQDLAAMQAHEYAESAAAK